MVIMLLCNKLGIGGIFTLAMFGSYQFWLLDETSQHKEREI